MEGNSIDLSGYFLLIASFFSVILVLNSKANLTSSNEALLRYCLIFLILYLTYFVQSTVATP